MPECAFQLSDDFSIKLFDQLRIAVAGMAIEVQLVHLSLDPKGALIAFGKSFLYASRDSRRVKTFLLLICWGIAISYRITKKHKEHCELSGSL
jgi:hypothetical protein